MPLADDLLSLELDDAFTDLYLVREINYSSLLRLTRVHSGKIQELYSPPQKLS